VENLGFLNDTLIWRLCDPDNGSSQDEKSVKGVGRDVVKVTAKVLSNRKVDDRIPPRKVRPINNRQLGWQRRCDVSVAWCSTSGNKDVVNVSTMTLL
jgi:hypothetical protein